MKKIVSMIQSAHCLLMGSLMLILNGATFAGGDSDPFPKITVSNGDVVQAVGEKMETSMKYAMIGGGVIMLLVGIGVIMHRLREDSANKESGSFLTTLIIAGLSITVGIILISIGWAAASYTPSS